MPRWSKSDLIVYENRNANRAPSNPKPKPIIFNESMAAKEGKDGYPSRFQVRIVSHRRKLLDPDNLCGKYFLDCLRYAEIIPDDRQEDIEYTITQLKVQKGGQEFTAIRIVKLEGITTRTEQEVYETIAPAP